MRVTEPGTASPGFSTELKFVVDAAIGVQIREWARGHLSADTHGIGPWGDEYRVSSVYFDTDALDVYHRRGSYGRSKFRIRRYHEEPVVFLERKLRTAARLAKRRTSIDISVLPLLATPEVLNGDGTAWFRRRVVLRELHPLCQVTYRRTARTGMTTEGAVRMTLDEHMSALASDSFTFHPHSGTPLLQGTMILELKYRGAVPALFRRMIEDFRLAPRRSSKYRVAVETLGLVATPPGEAPHTVDA